MTFSGKKKGEGGGEKGREREERRSGGGETEDESQGHWDFLIVTISVTCEPIYYDRCMSPGSREIENEVLRRQGARAEVCSAAGRSPRIEVTFPETVPGLPRESTGTVQGAAGITVEQE